MGRVTHLPSAAMEPKLLWRPPPSASSARRSPRFARAVGREGDYDELWRWSVEDLEGFWGAIWELLRRAGLRAVRAGARPRARCPARSGSRARGSPTPSTSSATATTTRWRSATPASCASCREWTWGELREQTRAHRRRACGALGVGPGDRVAAYMPNIPETIAAFLATASIGAVWSSVLAGVRRALGRRPLRADRAEGAAGRRRLPLRRARPRPPRGRRRHRARRSARTSCASATSTATRLAVGARGATTSR